MARVEGEVSGQKSTPQSIADRVYELRQGAADYLGTRRLPFDAFPLTDRSRSSIAGALLRRIVNVVAGEKRYQKEQEEVTGIYLDIVAARRYFQQTTRQYQVDRNNVIRKFLAKGAQVDGYTTTLINVIRDETNPPGVGLLFQRYDQR